MKVVLKLILCLFLSATLHAQSSYYVLFEYNKAVVPDTAMAHLIKTIYTRPVTHIYLEGHCDSIGSKHYNYQLSKRRVKAVEELLVDNGFAQSKIEGKVGYGKDKPLVGNGTPTARQQNRRVLVKFVYGKKEKVNNKPPATIKKLPKKIPQPDRSSNATAKKVIKRKKIIKYQKPAIRPKALKVENFIVNEIIELPNINFQGGRHYLIPSSTASLDTLLKILRAKPTIRIEIQGHVCCTTFEPDGYDWDTRSDNLSLNRALAIKEYLIKNGISSTRIETKGFGGSRKLYPVEDNLYQRRQNRRVEVKVLSD